MDIKTRKIAFWFILIASVIYFLVMISAILLPFVVGMLCAYFLDPAADALEDKGLSRTAATGAITAIFFTFIILLAIILMPLIIDQFASLINNIPIYTKKISTLLESNIQKYAPEYVDNIGNVTSEYSLQIANITVKILHNLLESGGALLNLISLIFISPIVSFFLLRDWDKMIAKIDVFLPRKHADVIRQQILEIDNVIAGYIRGQSNVCIILAVFYGLGLTLVGLEFGLFIGIVTGLLAFLPYVGMAMGMTTALIVAFFQFGDLQNMLMVLAVFVTGQVIEGNFITPKLVGDKVGLHPVWIIFGLLSGGALFGFIGILIAIPVTAIIGVLVRFALTLYMDGTLYDKK